VEICHALFSRGPQTTQENKNKLLAEVVPTAAMSGKCNKQQMLHPQNYLLCFASILTFASLGTKLALAVFADPAFVI
jgi:hypothetical protein